MNWKKGCEIEPQGGEQYLCMDKDCEMYILHFCRLETGKPMKWYMEGQFGFEVAEEPLVAALIETEVPVDMVYELAE